MLCDSVFDSTLCPPMVKPLLKPDVYVLISGGEERF